MNNILINIAGNTVPLEDLQADVIAAKAKGFNHDYAFTAHTVQGLIDKINELTKENQNTNGENRFLTTSDRSILFNNFERSPFLISASSSEFKKHLDNAEEYQWSPIKLDDFYIDVQTSFCSKSDANKLYNKMSGLGMTVYKNWI